MYEPLHLDYVPNDFRIVRELQAARMKAICDSSIILKLQPYEAKFKIGDKVLMRREKNRQGPKFIKTDWSEPFIVKEGQHLNYILRQEIQRKTR